MPLIRVQTEINADLETCFNLARDVSFYQESLKKSSEIPIGGKISGLVEKGDYVTWETNHLIFTQHLTLKVTEFEHPVLFVDEMVRGTFKAYKHEHIFLKKGNATIMLDKFYFKSPYGILGSVVDNLFLKKYMGKLLVERNEILKIKAEKEVKREVAHIL